MQRRYDKRTGLIGFPMFVTDCKHRGTYSLIAGYVQQG